MFEDMITSQREKEFYSFLFNSNKNRFSDVIDGPSVANLLGKTNLDKGLLRQIWDKANRRNEKSLNLEEFIFACRNVSILQQGMEVNFNNMKLFNSKERLAIFNGIDYAFKDEDEFVSVEEDVGKDSQSTNHKNGETEAQIRPTVSKLDDLLSMFDTPTIDDGKVTKVNDADEFIAIEEDEEETTNPPTREVTKQDATVSLITNTLNNNTEVFQFANESIGNNVHSQNFTNESAQNNGHMEHFLNEIKGNDLPTQQFGNESIVNNVETKQSSTLSDLTDARRDINEIPTQSKQIDFTELIFTGKRITNEVTPEKNIIDDVKESKSTEQVIPQEISKPALSLDDLLNTVDVIILNTAEVIVESNMSVPRKETDEFCEVFEEENVIEPEQPTNIPPTDQTPTYDPIEFLEQIRKGEQSIEEKPEVVKPSILTYTPTDFLTEFTKENKPNKAEDEFDFIEATEDNIQKEEDTNKGSEIDQILKRCLQKEEHIEKFKTNLNIISSTLDTEINSILVHLDKLKPFTSRKVNKFIYETDRKLNQFINGSIQLLILYKKLKKVFIQLELPKEENKAAEKLMKYFTLELNETTEQGIDFKKIIDESLVNKLKQFESERAPATQFCSMCFNNLTTESWTNVFSFDFHTSCINFYLNLVNSQSPYA